MQPILRLGVWLQTSCAPRASNSTLSCTVTCLLHLLQLIKLNFYVIIIYRICRFYLVINYNRDADADFADTENDVSEERFNVSAKLGFDH